MQTDPRNAPVLVAVSETRAGEIRTALQSLGRQFLIVSSLDELLGALVHGPGLILVESRTINLEQLRLDRDRIGSSLLCVLVSTETSTEELEGWSELGAAAVLPESCTTTILTWNIQQLSRSHATSAHSPSGSFLVVDQGKFESRIRAKMPAARSEGTYLAVFALRINQRGLLDQPNELDELDTIIAERATKVAGLTGLNGEAEAGREVLICRSSEGYSVLVSGVRRIQDAARFGAALVEGPLVGTGSQSFDMVVGISVFPEDGEDPSQLVAKAFDAHDRGFDQARESLAFSTESMGRWAFERMAMEKSLQDAVRNEELTLYYQPRVDLESRRIVGMEALVRWLHPQIGLIPPAQFIPLAEETGLIGPIGEWVLREGCRQNAKWRAKGLPDIRVSVNLSPAQFRQPNLYESIMSVIKDSGLAEDGLELELTESMLMDDPKATVSTLRQLKSSGIHLSIDDFGTGYSSLSYLKRFTIDALKIDRSFVKDITTDPDDAAISTAIILLGHSLRLTVVAEGVETESQLDFLRALKCNEVQGFLFSPPVPPDRAEEFLVRQQRSVA